MLAAFLAVGQPVRGPRRPVRPSGRSAALLSLGAGQLAVAWGIRRTPVRSHGRRRGPPRALAWALPAAGLLLVASVLVPPLRTLLGTQTLSASGWAFAALTALGALALTRALRPRVL